MEFTSSRDYISGVSFYINPVTSKDQIIDISDTRGDGYYGYDNGTKDISEYDYIRLVVTSPNELNFKTYNGNDQLRSAGFPASSTSETYEGAGFIQRKSQYGKNLHRLQRAIRQKRNMKLVPYLFL